MERERLQAELSLIQLAALKRQEQLGTRQLQSLTAFEKSGKRLEWATWIILLATVVQLGLVVIPVVREHYRKAVASQPRETKQAVGMEADEPANVEQVPFDAKLWGKPDVDANCSGRRDILTAYPVGDRSQKEVTLTCVLKNLTSNVIAIANPHKVDALLRLPASRVVRVPHIYLGSSQREIPAGGEVRQAGLWLSNKTCPTDVSDQQCVQTVLMQANELLLTDISNGIRYHVRVE